MDHAAAVHGVADVHAVRRVGADDAEAALVRVGQRREAHNDDEGEKEPGREDQEVTAAETRRGSLGLPPYGACSGTLMPSTFASSRARLRMVTSVTPLTSLTRFCVRGCAWSWLAT